MEPHGTFPVLPTVLHDDGTLDLDGQRALAATVAAAGVDGVVVLGLTSGEVADLTDDERAATVTAAREGAGGLPLLVGVGTSGPGLLEASRRAAATGADGLLAPLATDPVGRDRLGEVAGLGLPLVLQHHPVATGVTADVAAIVEACVDLAPRAVLVEQAPPADLIAALVAANGPPALGGLAGLFLPEELEAGAVGTVAGGAVPERLAEVVARHRAAEPGASRDAFLELLPYLRLEVGGPGPRVRKEAWRQRGVIGSSRVRRGAPLGTATKQAITRRLRDVGIAVPDPYPGA
jgi:4-hydroxy-tetrahydrodipicolinate synthase